jgi:endonuclease/exonuclease/phosphatase family metal-dependent hydrolase
MCRFLTLLVFAGVVAGCVTPPASAPSFASTFPADPDELFVMSFNIRMIMDNDASRRSWTDRREDVVSLIQRYSPSIVALQEVENRSTDLMPESEQLKYLTHELSEYQFACVPESGVLSRQPILYDDSLLTLLEEGMILDAPIQRYREGFRGRIATWARFSVKSSSGSEPILVRVINIHYHHLFTSSQLASSLRIRDFIKHEVSEEEAVIVLGDFNLLEGSYLLDPLRDAGLRQVLPPSPTGSFHGFTGTTLWPRIDHVFVNAPVELLEGHLLYDRTDRGYPSDHFPVLARLSIRSSPASR